MPRLSRLLDTLHGPASDAGNVPDLPGVARAYAERAAPGLPVPPAVRLTQRADIRLRPDGRWLPLTATQTIRIPGTGFA